MTTSNKTQLKFKVPSKEEVSPENQTIFDGLKEKVGFVPNVYATYGKSDHALGRYLTFSNGETSLSAKEKEIVNLVVSQVNGCRYCQAAHTALGKMNGFTDDQIIQIRKGSAPFDQKLDALVKLSKNIALTHGRPEEALLHAYFDAGFTEGGLVDLILAVGERITTNYLNKVFRIPVDFPEATILESEEIF
jgi:uncharacterized peroxidase-related enzyme